MFVINDIEVMILTVNRLKYFKKSLESVLSQNVKVTVVDNASTDGTGEYVQSLLPKFSNLHYFKQEKLVPAEQNLATAISLTKAKYVMFFHDDDVLHPQYIEYALKALNKYQNVDIICSLLRVIKNDEEPDIKLIEKCECLFFKNKLDFVTYAYTSFHTNNSSIIYPNIIYRTENIKHCDFLVKTYGKIGDKPFVINSIKKGSVVQLKEPFLYYRIHRGQDTENSKNGPFEIEIENHNKFFKELMSVNLKTRLFFNVFAMDWLFVLNSMRKKNLSISEKKQIVKHAYENGAINFYTYALYFSCCRSILRRLNNFFKKQIAKKDKYQKVEFL